VVQSLIASKTMSAVAGDFDYLVKIVVVGESGVGKSSLLKRFADDEFMPNYISTIGVDFAIRSLDLDDRRVKLQIWDTAGQERFHNITTSYYRGAHGVLLCIDVTDADSVRSVSKWMKEIEQHADEGVAVLLVANKCDSAPLAGASAGSESLAVARPRVIDAAALAELSRDLHLPVVETSARDRRNVDAAFTTLARAAVAATIARLSDGPSPPGGAKLPPKDGGLDLTATQPSTLRCCVIL